MSRRRDEQGAVAIMVSLVAVLLFVVAALVVDLGLARDTKRQSQNAADSAALAAGNKLYSATGSVQFATAIAEAKSYALTNFDVPLASWTAGTGCQDAGALAHRPDGLNQCISFDSATSPTLVRVKMPVRNLRAGLGTLAGISRISVDAAARVALKPPGLPCVVCVLGSGQTHDLQNGDVFVNGGNIHFNGSVSVGSNGFVVTNGSITVEGSASPNPTTNFTPDATTSQPAIADPLGFLVLPPDMSTLVARTNPCTQGPGLYGDFSFPNSTCTLTPGLYVISGPSGTKWAQSGNSSSIIAGTGVTLYFTCGTPGHPVACTAPGQTGAQLDASGNGSIQISPPTSGPLTGVAIAYDRYNNATMKMTGNGMSGMSGAIYMTSGKLQMNGNGCTQTNSAIVVNSIEMNGNPACLSVQSNPSANPVPPPSDLYLDQ